MPIEGGKLNKPAFSFGALLGFFMGSVGATESAILLELQFVRCRPLIFRRGIVSALALPTSQGHNFSHDQPL
jgi:hypothetical protein